MITQQMAGPSQTRGMVPLIIRDILGLILNALVILTSTHLLTVLSLQKAAPVCRQTGIQSVSYTHLDGNATDAAVSAAAPVYDAAGLPVRCAVGKQSAGYVRPAVGLRRSAKRRGQAGERCV